MRFERDRAAVFTLLRLFHSARSSAVLPFRSSRSLGFTAKRQRHGRPLSIAIITRTPITDLGCKRHYIQGPIMHAIDSGHFVISIPSSPADARSLLSPDGRLRAVTIHPYQPPCQPPSILRRPDAPSFPGPEPAGADLSPGLSAKRFLACAPISRATTYEPALDMKLFQRTLSRRFRIFRRFSFARNAQFRTKIHAEMEIF